MVDFIAYTDRKVKETIKKLKLGSMRHVYSAGNKYFVYGRPANNRRGFAVFDKDGNLLYDDVRSVRYNYDERNIRIEVSTEQGSKSITLDY